MTTYTPETIFFFSIFIIFLFAVRSLFKIDKETGVKIVKLNNYTGNEDFKPLPKIKPLPRLNNSHLPIRLKNQRQKRKQKHHINKF